SRRRRRRPGSPAACGRRTSTTEERFTTMELRDRTLGQLPEAVRVPAYDRSALRGGIVHFGIGHFHRAHQALYLDDLFNAGLAHDWAVTGIGVMPSESALRDALVPQDGLYTLTEKSPDGTWDTRVIGSVIDFHWSPDDPERSVDIIADPATRIVSLTITEGGYDVDDLTGEFVGASPMVQEDLAAERPLRTVFGL